MQSGQKISGERTAVNKQVLTTQLRRERITPGAIREKGKEFVMPTFGTGKVKTKDIAIFFRQFSVMIDAGLPLVQCLEILAANQENPAFQKTLTGVRTTVEGGATLANAMKLYPKIFDDLTTNMIEAGETGGILDIILQRLAIYIEKAVKLRAAVKSALIYPVSVVSLAFLIVGALLKWVVPIFSNLFIGLGVALPLPTRIVMGLSAFVGQFWWFFIVGVVGLVFGMKQIRKHPKGRYYFDYSLAEVADSGCAAAQDRGGALYPDPGNPDHVGRAHPGRSEHYRQDLGQRRAGRSADEGAQGHRRRPHHRRSAAGIGSIPQHGDPDDRRRRSHGRHGRHVAKNCRLLRRRSRLRHQRHAGHAGTGHHRSVGRHDRRHRHFALHAAVLDDRQTGGLTYKGSRQSSVRSRQRELKTDGRRLTTSIQGSGSRMQSMFDERLWLAWLAKVRIIILTLLFGIELAIARLTPNPFPLRLFITVILLWYTISIFYLLLLSFWEERRIQALLQVVTDLVMVTLVVYATGGVDSSLNFLYPLVIIVACILLPRVWAYLTGALAFILYVTVLELTYFEYIPSYSTTHPGWERCRPSSSSTYSATWR